MFTSELIVGSGAGAVSLDLTNEIPVSLNYSIADIRQPERRNGAFSKTIKLKGTKINNKFFEHTYHVNIATNSWNPNVKTPCYIIQKGAVVFEGYLRLMQINVMLVNSENDIEYEVTLFGDNNTLFAAIGDNKLEDLDFSAYNHTYNRVNQVASWTSTLGSGYVYPLIDYGYNNFLTNSFKVEWFRPAIYAKAYVDKIFAAAGKTYTSSFFNTTEFKRLIIPHNGDKFTMAASNLAQYEFYAGDTGLSTANSKSLSSYGTYLTWMTTDPSSSTSASYLLKFNDDTTNPFVDTGNRYDPSTGIFTVGQTGTYTFTWAANFEIKFTSVPAGTVTINMNPYGFWGVHYKALVSTDGGTTWNISYQDLSSPAITPSVITTSYQTFNHTMTLNQALNAGDKLKFHVHPLNSWDGHGIIFKDSGGFTISAGTAAIDWRYVNTATLKCKFATSDYVSGQSLVLNDAIPKDIKQRDFLTSLFKMFNLYVDIDADNPDNYIIETRDDFYSAGVTVDWSEKLAWDKQMTIKPMAEIDWKTLIYKYKDDQDFYNKQYQDAYYEAYGTYTKTITNDFTNKITKNELIFSPTMVVDNPSNTLIIPKIFNYDGTTVKPQKHNIRILRYNGVETMTGGSWAYVAPTSDALGAASLNYTTYPQTAMVDDPLAPTVSIEFGVPNQVNYSLGTNYTDNNLFNRYYYRQVAEVSDRDAKLVTAYVFLNPTDISQFDFRNTVFLKDAYYLVNKIIDYNPLEDELTKVELLKINDADAYSPLEIGVGVIETNNGNIGIEARMYGVSPYETNIGKAENLIIGENNSSRSGGDLISGDNNRIGEWCDRIAVVSTTYSMVSDSCSGISLINCSGIYIGGSCHDINLVNCFNITVPDYAYGISAFNVSGRTFAESDSSQVVVQDLASPKLKVGSKTADFTVDPDINIYQISCPGGANLTATINVNQSVNKIVNFKRIDSNGTSFIINSNGGTIDGNAFPYNTGIVQYNNLAVFCDGSNLFII